MAFLVEKNKKGELELLEKDDQGRMIWLGQILDDGHILIDTTLKTTDEFRQLLDLIDKEMSK